MKTVDSDLNGLLDEQVVVRAHVPLDFIFGNRFFSAVLLEHLHLQRVSNNARAIAAKS